MSNYKTSASTRAKWDRLHREFGCCGGLNFNDGYKIWRNADVGLKDNGVPDSCCLRETPGCGRNKFREADVTMDIYIYTHGCITVMTPKLEGQVRSDNVFKSTDYFSNHLLERTQHPKNSFEI